MIADSRHEPVAPKGSFNFKKNELIDIIIEFLKENDIDELLNSLMISKSLLKKYLNKEIKNDLFEISDHEIKKVGIWDTNERFENLIDLIRTFNRFKNFTPKKL